MATIRRYHRHHRRWPTPASAGRTRLGRASSRLGRASVAEHRAVSDNIWMDGWMDGASDDLTHIYNEDDGHVIYVTVEMSGMCDSVWAI